MLDVLDFITERGGDPEKIRESQRRRYAPVEIVDEIIDLWQDHRRTAYAATQLKAQSNEAQKKIAAAKKAKEDAKQFMDERASLEKEYSDMLKSAHEKEALLSKKLNSVGNLIHSSVPVSKTEDDNPTIRTWVPEGVTIGNENKDELLSHHHLLLRLNGYDPDAGVKVAGHRGYFLKNYGVWLNQAIINYGLNFLSKKGFTPMQCPFMMSKNVMAATAQLEDFDEQLYKVLDGADEKYLIASEQPLSAVHKDEWLQPSDLPIKYAGYSTNFRREAGSHGKDAWGTFRVHQFEKIEQFVICDPEKSWEMFDEMIANAEEFCQSLGLPYRVVAIVSGAFNQAASKKYDLEAWFPNQGEYKELVSCSNCTDYQSRALEIRFGSKKQTDAKKNYVHCLNSTLTATSRTMCAILENFQTPEGVRVPEPLRKYIPGEPDFLPFVQEIPATSQVVKNKPKAEKGGKQKSAAGAVAGAAGAAVQQVADKLKEAKV